MDDKEFIARAKQYILAGYSRAQMIAAFGMSKTTFYRRWADSGLAAPRADHSAAIPWTLPEAQDASTEVRKLRELSLAAQDREPYQGLMLNTAIRWARDLVARGLDITWDGTSWRTPPADPERWHIKTVLEAALAGLRRQGNS